MEAGEHPLGALAVRAVAICDAVLERAGEVEVVDAGRHQHGVDRPGRGVCQRPERALCGCHLRRQGVIVSAGILALIGGEADLVGVSPRAGEVQERHACARVLEPAGDQGRPGGGRAVALAIFPNCRPHGVGGHAESVRAPYHIPIGVALAGCHRVAEREHDDVADLPHCGRRAPGTISRGDFDPPAAELGQSHRDPAAARLLGDRGGGPVEPRKAKHERGQRQPRAGGDRAAARTAGIGGRVQP